MNKETRKALEGSIKKWESIVAGTGKDMGTSNCPLCERFSGSRCTITTDKHYVEHCPVKQATGEVYCAESPYDDWLQAQEEINGYNYSDNDIRAADGITVMCAQLELEFLKSLRPTTRSK